MEIEARLRSQLNDRIRVILQALKNYSLNGIIDNEKVRHEKLAILQRIGEEQEFLDGIETVFRALLER